MNGALLGAKYFVSRWNRAQTVVPAASAPSSRQRKSTPPSVRRRPRWFSYHAYSRSGSAALKNTPPSPVTRPMVLPSVKVLLRGRRRVARLVHVRDPLGNLVLVDVRRDRLVVVLEHLFDGGAAGLHALGRNVDLRDPDDGVEDGLAEVVLRPVPVDVAARAAEPARAVLVLADPDDVLGKILADPLAHLGVAAVGVVLALAGAVRRDGGEDRRHAFHL